MIGIRTDANNKIAVGHLMRCMSIAWQLRNFHLEVLFILSENSAASLLEKNDFSYICLHNQYDQKEAETEILQKLIVQNKIDRLLIDSYEVTYNYMKDMQKVCKTIYIDDWNRFQYPADLIINYTCGAKADLYTERGYQKQQLLLGSKYVPLRPEFSQERIKIQKDISSIFISTGGTDPFDSIICLLKKLQNSRFRHAEKNIVTGKFYQNMDKIEKMCRQDAKLFHYHDIQDVCSIMRRSDLAISAGGTTVLELCSCGVPTICITIADNQHVGIKAYADAGMVVYAGDVRVDSCAVMDCVVQEAGRLQDDLLYRERLGAMANKVVDGKGAFRIAEVIKGMCSVL